MPLFDGDAVERTARRLSDRFLDADVTWPGAAAGPWCLGVALDAGDRDR